MLFLSVLVTSAISRVRLSVLPGAWPRPDRLRGKSFCLRCILSQPGGIGRESKPQPAIRGVCATGGTFGDGAIGCEFQGRQACPPVNLLRCTTDYRKASPKEDAVCGAR
jgi:hypothetical protein